MSQTPNRFCKPISYYQRHHRLVFCLLFVPDNFTSQLYIITTIFLLRGHVNMQWLIIYQCRHRLAISVNVVQEILILNHNLYMVKTHVLTLVLEVLKYFDTYICNDFAMISFHFRKNRD